MTDKKPPPSAHERQALVAKRKTDIPTLAPAPRPKGIEASYAERRAQWERQKQSFDRESRIREIDTSINKARGVAKSGFGRAR